MDVLAGYNIWPGQAAMLLYLAGLPWSISNRPITSGIVDPQQKKKSLFPNGLARVKVLSISVDALDHPAVLLVLLLDFRDGCDHAIIHITYGVCALFSITMRAFDQAVVRDDIEPSLWFLYIFVQHRVSSPLHMRYRALTARNSGTPNASLTTTSLLSSNMLVYTVLFFHVRMLAAVPSAHTW